MRRYDDSKIRATSASVKRGLKALGLEVRTEKDDIYRTCEVTDPETGKHFCNIRFNQNYSWSDVNIRVEHAGIEKKSHWDNEQRKQDPYCQWRWAGRNYKIASSAVNAIDKFRSSIPSDDVAKLAVLDGEVQSAWRDAEYSKKAFRLSFDALQLINLLDLVEDDADYQAQRDMLTEHEADNTILFKAQVKRDRFKNDTMGEA